MYIYAPVKCSWLRLKFQFNLASYALPLLPWAFRTAKGESVQAQAGSLKVVQRKAFARWAAEAYLKLR